MSKPGALEQFRALTGLAVIPGTLNIKLVEPLDLTMLKYQNFTELGWEFDPATQGNSYKGELGVYYRRAKVAEKYEAFLGIFTWVRNIHTDAELVSPHHLRTVLKLKDGDELEFTLD